MLADMFRDDPTKYGLAKSTHFQSFILRFPSTFWGVDGSNAANESGRISTLQSATSIGLPMIGGWLAMYDIRLPWAIATIVPSPGNIHVMNGPKASGNSDLLRRRPVYGRH